MAGELRAHAVWRDPRLAQFSWEPHAGEWRCQVNVAPVSSDARGCSLARAHSQRPSSSSSASVCRELSGPCAITASEPSELFMLSFELTKSSESFSHFKTNEWAREETRTLPVHTAQVVLHRVQQNHTVALHHGSMWRCSGAERERWDRLHQLLTQPLLPPAMRLWECHSSRGCQLWVLRIAIHDQYGLEWLC
ncbi:unnamed protein product [Lampetra fluviatilis]